MIVACEGKKKTRRRDALARQTERRRREVLRRCPTSGGTWSMGERVLRPVSDADVCIFVAAVDAGGRSARMVGVDRGKRERESEPNSVWGPPQMRFFLRRRSFGAMSSRFVREKDLPRAPHYAFPGATHVVVLGAGALLVWGRNPSRT